jgi:alkylation response protein AidB-like acyl-CoA dehydrogenase
VHFAYNEDQELLRSTTRKFLEQNHSIAALRNVLESEVTIDRSIWKEGAALGWTAFLVSPEHDGGSITDQPVVDLAGLFEELGRQLYPSPLLETNLVADAIAKHGSTIQRQKYLRSIAVGDLVATWCLSGDGTTYPESVEVRAEVNGDSIQLTGTARFVRDAHVADLLLVTTKSSSGTTLVAVPIPVVGLNVRVLQGLDLTRRICEVSFDNVTVPADSIVGSFGDGAAIVENALQLATVLQSAECAGAAQHLFEATVQYCKDRFQFGRAIGSFQAIKHRLADLQVRVEAMTAAARYAALTLADRTPDSHEAIATAGSYVRESFAELCGDSLQLHGGLGFTWEHDVHLFLRRSKSEIGMYGDPYSHRERLCALLEARVLTSANQATTVAGVN